MELEIDSQTIVRTIMLCGDVQSVSAKRACQILVDLLEIKKSPKEVENYSVMSVPNWSLGSRNV